MEFLNFIRFHALRIPIKTSLSRGGFYSSTKNILEPLKTLINETM
jgi:hypothetical protein